ncbi:hypothetical protein [Spirosoma spitsbergense]|uniref:hypothetical protein n=1 Tax=Spirosoma spitsbergense TaxID=431554 RepID=UPI000378AE9C|nr:hypothetical protein [Spirosoma spitsbergense]
MSTKRLALAIPFGLTTTNFTIYGKKTGDFILYTRASLIGKGNMHRKTYIERIVRKF